MITFIVDEEGYLKLDQSCKAECVADCGNEVSEAGTQAEEATPEVTAEAPVAEKVTPTE